MKNNFTAAQLKPVSKEEFYTALMAEKRNIQPHIVSEWDNETGYTHEWRVNGHASALFGVSTSGDGSGSGRGQSYKLAAYLTNNQQHP